MDPYRLQVKYWGCPDPCDPCGIDAYVHRLATTQNTYVTDDRHMDAKLSHKRDIWSAKNDVQPDHPNGEILRLKRQSCSGLNTRKRKFFDNCPVVCYSVMRPFLGVGPH